MSDEEFISRFERLEIPGCSFRHVDHIRLAWVYLKSGDFAQGAARFIAQFSRYVVHIGACAKYHETITWFYLVVINERIRSTRVVTWSEFALDNPDLLDPTMRILKEHYGPERLGSPLARTAFLLPR